MEKQGRTYKSWMENYNGETGFFLFKYSVPDHLPLRKKLHLQIILEKKNKEIEKRYGPLKIVLIKLSDE
ncbi:MAG: hypothetical protein HUN05_17510 [Desulfobacter sp.]|nr:MAG: hypothetical protein HUN05_17510 [Desulfobacter sp.]